MRYKESVRLIESVAHHFTTEEWAWLCASKKFDSLIDHASTETDAGLALLAGKAMLPVTPRQDDEARVPGK